MTPEELRQRVVAACTALREKGFTIRTGFWGFGMGINGDDVTCVKREPAVMACCAMGALAIHEELQIQDDIPRTRGEFLATALGLYTQDVLSFVEGFDNKEHTRHDMHQEWYDCGQQIYRDLIGSVEET